MQTFLAWLAARVELKDGDKQPEPKVLDEEAIELSTWHASKGREWPVVAVCGVDKTVEAKLPDMGLGYRSFEDLSRLLEVARIEYAPAFAAPETEERFLEELDPVARTEARRLLYVALTRARDKLLLEWPGYLAGKDKANCWSILTEECQVALGKDALSVGSKKFPCAVVTGGTELPEELELGASFEVDELPVIGRRAIEPGEVPTGLTPDSRTPSALPRRRLWDVGTRRGVGGRDGRDVRRSARAWRWDSRAWRSGAFLHRSFEVLGARPDLATRLPQITGVAVSAVRARAELQRRWRGSRRGLRVLQADVGAAGVAAAARGCARHGGVGDGGSDRAHGAGRVDRGSQVGRRGRSACGVRSVTSRSSRRTRRRLRRAG